MRRSAGTDLDESARATPPALLLAVETSLQPGSLALLRDGQVTLARALTGALPGPTLLSDIGALLRDAGARLSDVGAFALSTGPGAFTGLRVGLATIKGLAFALARPVVGVETLRAHALGGVRGLGALAPDTAYAPIQDARRGEVYAAVYTASLECLLEAGAFHPEALRDELRALGRPVAAFGTGALAYAERLGQTPYDAPALRAPHAAEVGQLAWSSWPEGVHQGPTLAALAPFYVRPADAERSATERR